MLDPVRLAPSDSPPMSAKRVAYCKSSTITEAWAAVTGFPTRFNPDEAGLVRQLALRQPSLGTLARERYLAVRADAADKSVDPFWSREVLDADGSHVARFGHRFLATHFLTVADRRYQTFELSLRPWLASWLEVVKDAYAPSVECPVARVGFGYVNTFTRKAADFALARDFKVSLGFGFESASDGVDGMTVEMRWARPGDGMRRHVTIRADVRGRDGEDVRLQTIITVETAPQGSPTFRDRDLLLDAATRVKEVAKATFFDLATESLHAEMGAVHDD